MIPALAPPVRRCGLLLLGVLAGLLLPGTSAAQGPAEDPAPGTFEDSDFPTREELPEEVVLVVKLVSPREVQPTTGVVVSEQGLVVVPSEFVDEDREIVVLDGGGNIARNGRRSRLLGRSPSGGLALLEVDGLRRAPARLARLPGREGDELRLGAFPPAEQLRRGMGPLWIPVRLSGNEAARIFGLDPEATMPNVSGPLFNRCEQWVGYGLAAGTPSLDTRFQPIVLFADDLVRELEALGQRPPEAVCEPLPDATQPPPASSPAEPPVSGPEPEPPVAEPPAETRPDPTTDGDPADDRAAVDASGSAAERERTARSAGSADGRIPWPPVLALLLATLLVGWWWRRSRTAAARAFSSADEPHTRVLAEGRPRSPASPALEAPDARSLPADSDGLLVLRGQDGNGAPLGASAPIRGPSCSLRVGRRNADLVIDEDTVSASHALIEGSRDALTIVDLESRNGTRVDGVPCLAGERLCVDADTVIMLGANHLRLAWLEAPRTADPDTDTDDGKPLHD